MSTLIRILLVVLVLVLGHSTNLAQTQPAGSSAITVSVTAGNNHVRYVSVGEVQQTRLQVFGPSGAQVFDSQFKLGNLVDWPLQDQQGVRIADGSYLFVVTVKDFSGQLAQKYGTTQVDQDQLYLERTEAHDLPQAQALALESNRQGSAVAMVDRIGALGTSAAASTTQPPNSAANSKSAGTKTGEGSNLSPDVAGTGTPGQLTKWVDGSGTLANSVVSELGNNIGIGTNNPSTKLSVVSSTEGPIASFGGNGAPNLFQVSYNNGAIGLTSSPFGPLVLGTQNNKNIALMPEGSGNVGLGTVNPGNKLSVMGNIDLTGNLGIGTNAPTRKLSVVIPTEGPIAGFGANGAPNLFEVSYNAGTVGLTSSPFGPFVLGTQNNKSIALMPNGNGNVGVGTANPSTKFSVVTPTEGNIASFGANGVPNLFQISYNSGAIGLTGSQFGPLVLATQNSKSIALMPDGNGNVGVGTANPSSKLSVVSATEGNIAGFGANGTPNLFQISYNSGAVSLTSSPFGPLVLGTQNNKSISFMPGLGNVGIGTVNPQAKLDVTGDVYVSGNTTISGNIAAKYQDVAEWVSARHALAAGTVVIVDGTRVDAVTPSQRSYDTLVAGVVSAKPGLILGEASDDKVMVATTGRVMVKVDATSHPIKIGDLLVTSNRPGLAMKSIPIKVGAKRIHRPGTIVGKALQPLAGGEGQILVLLSLH